MTKCPYTKLFKTYAEQVEQLRSRGMIIEDAQKAEFALRHFNYYRLRGYWLPFEAENNVSSQHIFKNGTRFEDVLAVYTFDRKLRLLLMDAVERIEISVRAQWAYCVAQKYGSHAHLHSGYAYNQQRWAEHLEKLRHEVNRSKEAFIEHHREKYQEELPPVWAVCEVMSLGLLSRFYENIQCPDTQAAIAGQYGVHRRVFKSWLHHLSVVRNICAHHGRLWNRHLLKLEIPKKRPSLLAGAFVKDSPKLYNTLLMLLYLMDVIEPGHDWRGRLCALLAESTGVPLKAMGFSGNWQEKAIWHGDAV